MDLWTQNSTRVTSPSSVAGSVVAGETESVAAGVVAVVAVLSLIVAPSEGARASPEGAEVVVTTASENS